MKSSGDLPTNEELAKSMAEAKGSDEYPSYKVGLREHLYGKYCEYNVCFLYNFCIVSAISAILSFFLFAVGGVFLLMVKQYDAFNAYSSNSVLPSIFFWVGTFLFLPLIVLTTVTGTRIWWRRRKTYKQCLKLIKKNENERLRYQIVLLREKMMEVYHRDWRELLDVRDACVKAGNEYKSLKDRISDCSIGPASREARLVRLNSSIETNRAQYENIISNMLDMGVEKEKALEHLQEIEDAIFISDREAGLLASMPSRSQWQSVINIVNGIKGPAASSQPSSSSPPVLFTELPVVDLPVSPPSLVDSNVVTSTDVLNEE
ncbi:MAG: hypothetical protein Q7S19_01425 [bacterium]|nr:hypothetical protein [bacterium]